MASKLSSSTLINTNSHKVSNIQGLEGELDEDNIRFDYNDSDADIDYLDENYNEPLSSSAAALHNSKSEFNIEMLKNRTDILESFIMKPRMDSEKVVDEASFNDDVNGNDQLDDEAFDEEYDVGDDQNGSGFENYEGCDYADQPGEEEFFNENYSGRYFAFFV